MRRLGQARRAAGARVPGVGAAGAVAFGALAFVLAALGSLSAAGTATGADGAARPLNLGDVIGAPAKVRQMVVVTSPDWWSTTGQLRVFDRDRAGGRWTLEHGPAPIVLGYAGWVVAHKRHQNSGTTPAGRFSLPFGFGNRPAPGTQLRYHLVDGDDWWPYEPRDPATYNVYQFHKDPRSRWRPDYAEHLVDYPTQYSYAIVVGFNLPSGIHYSPSRNQRVATYPAHIHRGGGIFLHVRSTASTEGCVAMASEHLRWLLGWIDPADHPQVVMGPYHYVLTHLAGK